MTCLDIASGSDFPALRAPAPRALGTSLIVVRALALMGCGTAQTPSDAKQPVCRYRRHPHVSIFAVVWRALMTLAVGDSEANHATTGATVHHEIGRELGRSVAGVGAFRGDR